ncbi:MAG: DNA-3-methyladenine glycosylase 2 family protein [Burkholderiales bacterium]|jgi:DNA-3-methyladenine glycosylase II|nr:DNA-3-methyladenine glycosylase 2 family protein [Burkholderiales bacterium]
MATAVSPGYTDDPLAPGYWEDACRFLSSLDARWAGLIAAHRDRALRSRGDAYQTLVRAVLGQQISVKAADAISARLMDLLKQDLNPATLLAQAPADLKAVGLSYRKVEYLLSLSEFAQLGGLDAALLAGMDDVQCVKHLTQVKGIGRWTAEMFLIFNLMRQDVWPVDDLGLVKALAKLMLEGKTPDRASTEKMGEALRPYRSVATWYLWRSLDPIAVDY